VEFASVLHRWSLENVLVLVVGPTSSGRWKVLIKRRGCLSTERETA